MACAKALDALLDFLDDFLERTQVRITDIRRKFSEDVIHVGMMFIHQGCDVIFVDANSQKIALAVERGQGIEFQQQQSPHCGDSDIVILKMKGGDMLLLDFSEERVGSEQDVDLQSLKFTSGEELVPIRHLNFGRIFQIFQSHDQVDILGIASFDVI